MTTSDIPGFPQHLASVPYSSPASRLRTVDIWLPEKANATKSDSDGLWLIYLHGGAWRDPTQDSRCVLPTLSHLSTTYPQTLNQLSGIASLNYRLSPYENHPTDPSKDDEERSAKHPQHVQDVISGLHFLAREYGVKRWIGVGHSCGATLLLQVVGGIPSSNQIKEEVEEGKVPGPEGLILLEGIYHFPLLLKNHVPPSTPQHIADIYKEFLAGPFGAFSEETYLAASPVSGTYSVEHWPEGKLLVICHSYADELVERAQRDVMCVALDRQGWSIVMEVGDAEDEVKGGDGGTRRVLNVRDLQGGHDEIWEDGKQIAQLIAEVVQRLEK